MTDSTLATALDAVRARIATACQQADRDPASVTLLAVSKTQPPEALRAAHVAGCRAFGENYVRELIDKHAALADLPELEWHFIGPLQSNKTRSVAELASWVHGIDRLKIAERLSEQRPAGLAPLNVCIQVNVSGEETKSGCTPAEALDLAHQVAKLPNLKLRGLMCLPEPTDSAAWLDAQFATVVQLQQMLIGEGLALDTLSMGMSGDLEAAIANGSTLVRVGSAIFGARPAKA